MEYIYIYIYIHILYIYIYIYIVTFHCHPKFTHQPNLYLHHLLYKAFQWCCRPTHFMTCFPELFFNICTLGPSIQQCCMDTGHTLNLSLTHTPQSRVSLTECREPCSAFPHPSWPSYMPLLQNYYGHTLLTACESLIVSVLKLAGDFCQLEQMREESRSSMDNTLTDFLDKHTSHNKLANQFQSDWVKWCRNSFDLSQSLDTLLSIFLCFLHNRLHN